MDPRPRRRASTIAALLVFACAALANAQSEAPDALVQAVRDAVDDHGAGALVIGLPLNMDDTEGAPAKAARTVGAALGEAVGLPVHFQDERLTSADADWSMAQSGMTHKEKKALRDALAAAAILRDFLATR